MQEPKLEFLRDRALGNIGRFEMELAGSSGALQPLLHDTPPEGDLSLGRVRLEIEAGADVKFSNAAPADFRFQTEANVFGRVGLYRDPRALVSDLGVEPALGEHLPRAAAGHYFAVIAAGFAASAKADGSVVLSPAASATLGLDADSDGFFAVLARTPSATGSRTGLQKAASNWAMPRTLDASSDLDPGTWLLTEVGGELGLRLGATMGYDFNWVRETALAGLSGDIGLRLQMGASVAVGMRLQGRFTVLIAREDDRERVRLRLFKSGARSWSFTFDAAVAATPREDLLPEKEDAFVKAVFGLQTFQVLGEVRKWTEPGRKLSDLVMEEYGDYPRNVIEKATGLDLEREYAKARKKLQDLFERWDALDERLAAKLMEWIESRAELDDIRSFARSIEDLTPAKVKAAVGKAIARAGFADTAVGQWIEAAVDGPVLSLFEGSGATRLKSAAARTLAVLDGGEFEGLLERLVGAVNERLDIERIEAVVSDADFAKLDGWLKKRLSDFLGETLDRPRLEEIRRSVRLLHDKQQEFYARAREALGRTYDLDLRASYQKATSDTALLDAEFDFSGGPTEDTEVSRILREAIRGDFRRLLIEDNPRILLHAARLTHGIRRERNVEVSLPHWDRSTVHFNEALAGLSVINDDGRVLLYDLDATDRVVEASARRGVRDSQMMVGIQFERSPASEVRVHSKQGVTHSYAMKRAVEQMKWSRLRPQLGTIVSRYFPDEFGGDRGGIDDWARAMEDLVERQEPNGDRIFGNVLVSLELSVTGEVLRSWFGAPKDPKAETYRDFSHRLQSAVRELTAADHFSRLENYGDLGTAAVMLVYAALPPSRAARLVGGRLQLDLKDEIYWDWMNRRLRHAMIGHGSTSDRIDAALERIHPVLEEYKVRRRSLYKPTVGNRRNILERARRLDDPLLRGLLQREARVVQGAHAAALDLARFRSAATREPAVALRRLRDFGAGLTRTFNQDFGQTLFSTETARALGSLVLVEAARALAGEGPAPAPTDCVRAILDLAVVRSTVQPFPPEGFPDHGTLDEASYLVRQRLVSV